MKVKNQSKMPIEIGHTTIAPGKVVEIEDSLLYQSRAQSLRANGDLIFPFEGEPPAPKPVQVGPEVHKPKVLELVDDVKAPESKVEVTPKGDPKKGKSK
jgi:hypothetical protein